MFMCEDFDDGTSYLKADYSVNCESPEYAFARLYAVVMIGIYPIGTPLLYGALFYHYRDLLMKLRRDEVRAMGRQNERELKRSSKDLGVHKKDGVLLAQVIFTHVTLSPVRRHA